MNEGRYFEIIIFLNVNIKDSRVSLGLHSPYTTILDDFRRFLLFLSFTDISSQVHKYNTHVKCRRNKDGNEIETSYETIFEIKQKLFIDYK